MDRTTDGTAFSLSGSATAPTVVLIHGLGLTSAIWRDHISLLEEHYQVLRYDLCGHGQTAPPTETPSLAVLSNQLLLLLDHLEIGRADLIGFSLGGMINRRFAIDSPDRVRSLVILNSPHERSRDAQEEVEARARASDAGGPAATIDATLARWFTPEFLASDPTTVDAVRSMVLDNDAANYAAHRFVLATGVKELIRPDPPIDVPTLVMTSEFDTGSTPAMSVAIASEISGSTIKIAPGLKHLGLIENPTVFLEPTLRFLRRIR